jgi:hypothetical protein
MKDLMFNWYSWEDEELGKKSIKKDALARIIVFCQLWRSYIPVLLNILVTYIIVIK